MTAEIRGLGRMKESLASVAQHHSRAGRRARRAAAAEERRAQAEAAREARMAAKRDIRSRRRSMLRVVGTLAVFAAIAGGTIAAVEDSRPTASASAHASARSPRPSSLEEALEFLGQDDMEARYREAAEGSLAGTSAGWLDSREPARRLPPSTEAEISELGPMARILILTEENDDAMAREMRSTARRLRDLGAIPIGIDKRGRMTNSDHVKPLLARAREQVALAAGSVERSEARLASLAAHDDEIDAIYWVRRQPGTGYLRSSLATNKEACAPLDSTCSQSTSSRACGALATSGVGH